jgi:NAD(P)-dependent dehydrogenase (short-subunit alcohol dehydrogenase family)
LAIVARSSERATHALARINSPDKIDVLIADLAVQADVRRLAADIVQRYPRVDVLINNAGAMFARRQLTIDGIERTWAVNHLAPFLLTTLLRERLETSAPARVITTASAAHYGAHIPFADLDAARKYAALGFGRYGETKLANVLFTAELARELAGTGVTANCFHPGVVATGFNFNNGPLMSLAMWVTKAFARSPERGAETLVWLADSAEVTQVTGGYFFDKRLVRPSPQARDAEVAQRLWQVSEEQTRRRDNQSAIVAAR